MPTVIGFDGGGSRCAAFWIDHEGHVIDHGIGGSTHEWYGQGQLAIESVDEAVPPMLERQRVRPDLGAFTSPGGEAAFERFVGTLAPAAIHACGEADVQFAATRQEHGLLLLAGTGSFVNGRARDGRRLTVGGAGPVIGDDGSGHDIGILAMKQACLAEQLPPRHTPLADAVKEYLGASARWDIVRIFHQANPGRRKIAGLAPIVCEHAERGDPAALWVLDTAAAKLTWLAAEVVAALRMQDEPDVILVGGAALSPAYREALMRHLAPLFREPLRRHPLVYPPAVGAALLGLARLGCPLDEEGYARLARELTSLGLAIREE